MHQLPLSWDFLCHTLLRENGGNMESKEDSNMDHADAGNTDD